MRIRNAVAGDVWFQWKYGFYLIYGVLCIIYITILNSLPDEVKVPVTAILIFSDPAAIGLFFMGAVILLEKSQRVLNAVAVTPLKAGEYIVSKVLSLAVISLLVASVIGVAAGAGNIPLILIGTFCSSVAFTLLGMAVAAGTQSLNHFMIASVGVEVVCFIPSVLGVIWPGLYLIRISPFDAAMRLIYGSSRSAGLDILISLFLILILYQICYRRINRMFGSVGEVKL